jgi:hypothetical protein
MREHLVRPSQTLLWANLELTKGSFYSPKGGRTRPAVRLDHQPACRGKNSGFPARLGAKSAEPRFS